MGEAKRRKKLLGKDYEEVKDQEELKKLKRLFEETLEIEESERI